MRTRFETKYRWSYSQSSGSRTPDSKNAKQEYAEVAEAYREIVRRFPGSGIAAYAGLRLGGFHQYRRDFSAAATAVEQVATDFEGSDWADEAYFTRGLIELQARNRPQEARKWFQKILPPASTAQGDRAGLQTSASQQYLAAQQQLAIAEYRAGQVARAEARIELLGEKFPVIADRALDRFRRSQKDYFASTYGVDMEGILESQVASNDFLAVNTSGHLSVADSTKKPRSLLVKPTVPDATSVAGHVPGKDDTTSNMWVGVAFCIAGASVLFHGVFNFTSQRKVAVS